MNTLFPGRPNYVGPTEGYFGLLHHDKLCEYSHDVMERVAYVKDEKPGHEIPVRLHNMIYLGDHAAKRKSLDDDHEARLKSLDDYRYDKLKSLYDDYYAKRKSLYDEITSYIRTHIPDCAWDGNELIFDGVSS